MPARDVERFVLKGATAIIGKRSTKAASYSITLGNQQHTAFDQKCPADKLAEKAFQFSSSLIRHLIQIKFSHTEYNFYLLFQ